MSNRIKRLQKIAIKGESWYSHIAYILKKTVYKNIERGKIGIEPKILKHDTNSQFKGSDDMSLFDKVVEILVAHWLFKFFPRTWSWHNYGFGHLEIFQ